MNKIPGEDPTGDYFKAIQAGAREGVDDWLSRENLRVHRHPDGTVTGWSHPISTLLAEAVEDVLCGWLNHNKAEIIAAIAEAAYTGGRR